METMENKKYKATKRNILDNVISEEQIYTNSSGAIKVQNGCLIDSYENIEEFNLDYKEIPEKPKSIWDLKEDDTYFKISNGNIDRETFISWEYDGLMIARSDVFLTEKEAIEFLRKKEAISKIKKYIHDNGMEFQPDFEDIEQEKCLIHYHYFSRGFIAGFASVADFLPILPYFRSQRDCEKVIKNCEPELKIIFDVK